MRFWRYPVVMSSAASRTPNSASIRNRPTGRKLYDNYCDRCHEPYSSRGKKGPSLKGVFKQQYLSMSGLPANDERMTEIVKYGRAKMEGFGQVMTDQQIKDLLAYLHTL